MIKKQQQQKKTAVCENSLRTQQQCDRGQKRERKLKTGRGRKDRYLLFSHCTTVHSSACYDSQNSISLLNRLLVFSQDLDFMFLTETQVVMVGVKSGTNTALACSGNTLLEVGKWDVKVGGETVEPLTSHGCPLLPPGPWRKRGKEEKKGRKRGKKISHVSVIERKKDVWRVSNALLKAYSCNMV